MKEQIENLIQWIKQQPIKGCITGSCLLDYFEGQDVDIFVYDEKSFNLILYTMHLSPMFTILDKLEEWKFKKYLTESDSYKGKQKLQTYKFKYNTCVDVNVILKDKCTDVFSVLSSFDMDIICKGYDIQTKQVLDLTNGSTLIKIADWNRWNTAYYSNELWDMSRILRQLERCIKYHKRGYNTDLMVYKYIEIVDKLQEVENIFKSDSFDERLALIKNITLATKTIMLGWLQTHEITEEQLEVLKNNIKLLP
jgi:hypothetical protein